VIRSKLGNLCLAVTGRQAARLCKDPPPFGHERRRAIVLQASEPISRRR
jgi:hypothetical protein